jgi:hypothetical protein
MELKPAARNKNCVLAGARRGYAKIGMMLTPSRSAIANYVFVVFPASLISPPDPSL